MPKMNLSLILIIIFISFITPVWAKSMYVTDSIKITFRNGPSIRHKVLAMLKSGEEVEVLEELNSWTKVRLKDGKEGYVLSHYLSPNIPKSFIINSLQNKVRYLQEQLQKLTQVKERLEASNSELKTNLELKERRLAKVEKEYNDLKSGSANYIETKQAKEQLETENKRLKVQLATLLKRNKKLEKKDDRLWFLSGAGVLLVGWVLGLILGRTQISRKRRYKLEI